MKQYFNKPTIIIAITALLIGIILGTTATKAKYKFIQYADWGQTQTSRFSDDFEGMHEHGMTGSNMMMQTGDAFDQNFLEQMISHHQGALEMADQALVKSQRPEIRKLAESIKTSQSAEILMMQDWLKTWFKK